MVRIGAVNIDTSHPLAFAGYLGRSGIAGYAAVYNDGFRSDDEVNAFIKKFNLEKRCYSLEELADCTDIGFIHGCNWDRHIKHAMPFLRVGKPVFIDKPIAGTLSDCLKIEKLERDGAVILGSSSVRYADEITDFTLCTEAERGRILNIFGTSGVDEFNYGIHIVEAISALAETEPEYVKFTGRSELDGKECRTFFVGFKNGITAVYNLFIGVWHPFEIVVMTTRSTYQFRIDSSKVYYPMLDRICEYMKSGNNRFASVSQLADSVRIMLAGRISYKKNGVEVKISDIPADDPGYDGGQFELEYGRNAPEIYLD